MPTIVYEKAPPGYTGPPRRMSTEDFAIWERFKKIDKTAWREFYFDTGIGEGKPVPDDTEPWARSMWLKETQKRIDVLAIAADKQVIIELRKKALPNAVGRLLVYKALYMKDPLYRLPLELWLVTDTTDPELQAIAEPLGIKYITV